MSRIGQAIAALRTMGPEWAMFRARYAFMQRSGLLERRGPAYSWDSAPPSAWLRDPALGDAGAYARYRASGAPRFFFGAGDRSTYQPLLCAFDGESLTPQREADEIAAGSLRYFGREPVAGSFPPDWHGNPFSGERAPADRHWSRLGDFAFGDIKVIWEPSRFRAAFILVRAYWRTADERYAETFWRLFESWREANPPARGPNWKCGQETTFRVMGWCFALYGFAGSRASTPARVALLGQAIGASGKRIEENLAYALSQRNNHGVSEGVGLFTIGTLFPELTDAARWQERGREVLESLALELIYPDGAFAQHSLNYQRLMLHDYVWALRIAELAGAPLSERLRERVATSADMLAQVQDACTGRVPVLGAMDGSLVLPLSNAAHDDFRPVVAAARMATKQVRSFAAGPWDEDLLWLFGPSSLERPAQEPPRTDFAAPDGGLYTLRSPGGFAMLKCATYRHRPGQADQLHVDVWWNGSNIALDPGTYGYNAREPWAPALDGTACHNTVTVDGLDQMERVSRFLWYPWTRGKAERAGQDAWTAEHDGYRRLHPPVSHRRTLAREPGESWLVTDELSCDAERTYRLHWLLADLPYEWDAARGQLTLQTDAGPYRVQVEAAGTQGAPAPTLIRADPGGPRGWRAPTYGVRVPALSLALEVRAARVTFRSRLGPAGEAR